MLIVDEIYEICLRKYDKELDCFIQSLWRSLIRERLGLLEFENSVVGIIIYFLTSGLRRFELVGLGCRFRSDGILLATIEWQYRRFDSFLKYFKIS